MRIPFAAWNAPSIRQFLRLSVPCASSRDDYFEIFVIFEPWMPAPAITPAWLKTKA